MAQSSKPIDFADIKLAVRGAVREALVNAVDQFQEHHDHIEVIPRWKKDELLINSTDLIATLGYFDSGDLSEIERRGFEKLLSDQIEQVLLRTVNLDSQSHYKWCLAALKSLEWGRYL